MFTKDELKENKNFEDIVDRFKGDSIQSLQLGLDYLIETDMREELKEIKVPILLIHGEQDVICPLSAARSMTENSSELKVVSEAGHALCVTNFEYCANEIIQFVEGIRHDQQNVTTKRFNGAAVSYDRYANVQKDGTFITFNLKGTI